MKNWDSETTKLDRRTHVNYIKLNPCQGCEFRGKCEVEIYATPGEYCRERKQSVKQLRTEQKGRSHNRFLKDGERFGWSLMS